ncbi:MAG: TOBE domain-containing protein, partial [Actinomycetota bacterium]
ADADLARFIGEANLIDGKMTRAGVETGVGLLAAAGGSPAVPPPGPVVVLIRPEQLEVQPPGPGGPGCLPGHVVEYGYHGHDAVLRVQPDQDSALPVLVVRTMGGAPLPPGSQVVLRARGPVLSWARD